MLKVGMKVKHNLAKWAKEEQKKVNKAFVTALKVEGFELMKKAKEDLKAGRLGLARKSFLTRKQPGAYRKRKGARRRQKAQRAPLGRLAPGIGYNVDARRKTLRVGFLGGSGMRARTARGALKALRGYRWTYTGKYRAFAHYQGIVHLRKQTAGARVPARDIMGAVEKRHIGGIGARIQKNFNRKLRGERI